jgi:transposase
MSTKPDSLLKSNSLEIENESLRALLKKEQEKSKLYETQVNWLTEQLNTLKRSKFGKKSEKWETKEQLLMVFNEAEVEAGKEEDSEVTETAVNAHTRKNRGHRKPLPENLSREICKVELPESERFSDSGESLKVIGWEVSEKLKYEPAKMSVIEYHRAKYGIDCGDYVKTAPPVPSIIPKGIATPELLAAVLVGKFADGLPLYRMEEIFQRQDIELSRSTMGRWVIQAAQAMMPIRNILSDWMFSSYCIACDETKVQVLKEKGRSPETNSWMIVRTTPYDFKKIALFDYSVSRSQATIRDLLAGYEGRLQCDGLNIYNGVEKLLRFGCHMHSRRKFEQAAVDGAKAGKIIANEIMNIYSKIYESEEKIKDIFPEEKVKRRREEQTPLLEKIKSMAEEHQNKIPHKSKLGEAFVYYLNNYETLIRYIDDGKIGPDNGEVERIIRKFAIGRNAWLFSDTPEGAEASSIMYSLIITAKINKVNPYKALVKILTKIPLAKSIEDYEALANLIVTPDST